MPFNAVNNGMWHNAVVIYSLVWKIKFRFDNFKESFAPKNYLRQLWHRIMYVLPLLFNAYVDILKKVI